MFDGLTGSKFSAKCKQSVKSTVARVLIIRKKKQAMLNFLKKDVADLLAQGHDQHAFSRMDGVVKESNHIRCYDLIADFCECIAAHLPVMHKLKRECPPECNEAVASLIYAAARFSDLPELCHLRTLFMERYGSALESSVNQEFKEKVSKHTLSKNGKLKLMQDIAQEHGVDWNLNNYGQKNAPAPLPEQDAAVTDQKEHKPADGMKYATTANNAAEQNAIPRQRHEAYFKGSNSMPKGRELQPKQDVSITNQKEHKLINGMKYAATTNHVEEQNIFPRQRPEVYLNGTSSVVPKARELQPFAKDIHIVAGSKSYFHPEAEVAQAEVKHVRSSSMPQDFRKEYRAEGRRNAELTYDNKKSTGGVTTGEVEKVNLASGIKASNMAAPYVKARDVDGASWDNKGAVGQGLDRVVSEKNAPVGLVKADGGNKDASGAALEEVEKVKPANGYNRVSNMAPPYVKPRHKHGAPLDKAAAPQQGLDSATAEKTPAGSVKENESNRALKEVDLYMKPSRSRMDDHPNKVASEEAAADRGIPKNEPYGAASSKPPTPAFFRPPPYLKPSKNNDVGNPMDYAKVADMSTPVEAGVKLHARSASEVENHPVPNEFLATTADKTPKPRSVRRNHRKPPSLVFEDAGQPLPVKQQNDVIQGLDSLEDGVPVNGHDAVRIPDRRKPRCEPKEREGLRSSQDAAAGNADDNAGKIGHERRRHDDRRRLGYCEDVGLVNAVHDAGRIPPGKYQQNDRRGLHPQDDEVDEDEKIDWLLQHYSRKGMPDCKHKIKRVVSLPHEDSPKAVRVPARAASSLTDEPSPNGRPVRHQLPDYDELAARLNALKRS